MNFLQYVKVISLVAVISCSAADSLDFQADSLNDFSKTLLKKEQKSEKVLIYAVLSNPEKITENTALLKAYEDAVKNRKRMDIMRSHRDYINLATSKIDSKVPKLQAIIAYRYCADLLINTEEK